MTNIEIKAVLDDIGAAEKIAADVAGTGPSEVLRQIDTYFRIPRGRLKLRQVTGTRSHSELISYTRPDQAGPKRSDYLISPVSDPAKLKDVLAAALGVSVTLDKQRTVYLSGNVRIHLDRVEGLGTFLEFEAVMPRGSPEAEGEELIRALMERFGVGPEHLLEGSYSDMIGKGVPPR